MSEIGKRIKIRRELLGLSQDELAKKLGYKSRSSINKIEIGLNDVTQSKIVAFADALETTPAWLMGWSNDPKPTPGTASSLELPRLSIAAQRIAGRYDKLDKYGQEAVESVVNAEYKRVMDMSEALQKARTKVIPLFGDSFAAGVGDPSFGNQWLDYEVPADSKGEFAIKINGDSMEPHLHDGSIALCKKAMPRDGDVGVFLLDGTFLVKQFCADNYGDVYLFALNRDRSDADQTIWASAERSFSCLGTVIMGRRIRLPDSMG